MNDLFIGREKEIKIFDEACLWKPKNINILMYYGIEGIGKRTISSHLKNNHPLSKKRPSSSIDLSLKNNLPSALKTLSINFSNKKFTLFNKAYNIYLENIHPDLEIKQNKNTFLEKYHLIHSIIFIINLFSGDFFNKIINFIENVLSYLTHSFKVFNKIKTIYCDFFKYNLHDEMFNKLSSSNFNETNKALMYFFYLDLNHSNDNSTLQNIIFINSYKNIFEKRFHEYSNNWIFEIINGMPTTLFVITGIDKLTWSRSSQPQPDYINLYQHHVRGLEYNDSNNILIQYNIEKNIRDRILQRSKEDITDKSNDKIFPFFLISNIEYFNRILISNKTVSIEDFPANNDINIKERLNNNLSLLYKNIYEEERSIWIVLAHVNFYNEDLYIALTKKFMPFVDTISNSFQSIIKSSITIKVDEHFKTHDLIKRFLLEECFNNEIINENRINELNLFLFEYYKLELDLKRKILENHQLLWIFFQMSLYKSKILSPSEYFHWSKKSINDNFGIYGKTENVLLLYTVLYSQIKNKFQKIEVGIDILLIAISINQEKSIKDFHKIISSELSKIKIEYKEKYPEAKIINKSIMKYNLYVIKSIIKYNTNKSALSFIESYSLIEIKELEHTNESVNIKFLQSLLLKDMNRILESIEILEYLINLIKNKKNNINDILKYSIYLQYSQLIPYLTLKEFPQNKNELEIFFEDGISLMESAHSKDHNKIFSLYLTIFSKYENFIYFPLIILDIKRKAYSLLENQKNDGDIQHLKKHLTSLLLKQEVDRSFSLIISRYNYQDKIYHSILYNNQ